MTTAIADRKLRWGVSDRGSSVICSCGTWNTISLTYNTSPDNRCHSCRRGLPRPMSAALSLCPTRKIPRLSVSVGACRGKAIPRLPTVVELRLSVPMCLDIFQVTNAEHTVVAAAIIGTPGKVNSFAPSVASSIVCMSARTLKI